MDGVVYFLLAALSTAPATEPTTRVTIFLTVPVRDGFVDATQGHADSLNDLSQQLKGMSEFTLVKDRGKADIVATILNRGVGSQAYGQRTVVIPLDSGIIATSVPIRAKDYWVEVLLEAGPTYKRLFVGAASRNTRHTMGAWSVCAFDIAKDLRAWVRSNGEQLKQLRLSNADRR